MTTLSHKKYETDAAQYNFDIHKSVLMTGKNAAERLSFERSFFSTHVYWQTESLSNYDTTAWQHTTAANVLLVSKVFANRLNQSLSVHGPVFVHSSITGSMFKQPCMVACGILHVLHPYLYKLNQLFISYDSNKCWIKTQIKQNTTTNTKVKLKFRKAKTTTALKT